MTRTLKVGLNQGYWGSGPPPGSVELWQEADRAGVDSIWTAEAYGSDVFNPLAWYGARTERVRLGTAIAQMSAREPTATAMAAMTLDHLSGGRAVLGLGVSGPQVVEGWYGKRFRRPLERTREYVSVVRDVIGRGGPVTHDGKQITLPYAGDDATGLAKPLKSTLHPRRADLPIFLAAEGPKNIALGAEICDGWLALFYSPTHEDFYRDALAEGFAREGARHTAESFECAASLPVILTDDVEAAVDMMRPMYALYFGGMGAKDKNFHADVPKRMGYEAEISEVQDLYLGGKKDEAAAKLPSELLQQLALIGPKEKIAHDLEAWKASQVDTLIVQGGLDEARLLLELV